MRGNTAKFAAAMLLLAACSPDPSTATRSHAVTEVGSPASYPNGPYGFGVGNTIPNLQFQGKPGFGSGQTDRSLRPISLADYQRHGTQKTKALVIVACAAWCEPCRDEQWNLNLLWDQYQRTNPGEVVFLNAMVQDGGLHAATERALDQWSEGFGVPYDLVLDPTASVMQHMDPNEQPGFPTILVVRTRNMRITRRTVGASDVTAAIDAILANANDPNAPPPATPGTIYPGPTPEPNCSLAGACGGAPPEVTCPGGFPARVRCRLTDDVPRTCGWQADPCPPPPPVGGCADAACGPKPDLPPDPCGDGSSLNLVCQQLPDGTCIWGGTCGNPPPPPPPPPISVDCSLVGACGPDAAPSSCPDGSSPIVQCLNVDGSCQWMEPCPPPPPPRIDCTPPGSCPGPVPTDVCLDAGMISAHVCEDVGGHCDWALVCSTAGSK